MKTNEDIRLLRDDEDKVVKLCAGITDYAIKITRLQISDQEHEDVARLLQVVSDIERVGDYCENIAEYAIIKNKKKYWFSDEAYAEIYECFDHV